MQKLFLVLVVGLAFFLGCTSAPLSSYRTTYKEEIFESSIAPKELYNIIVDKFKKCYLQNGIHESTKYNFDEATQVGTVYHAVEGVSLNILYLVDVKPNVEKPGNSKVFMYANGDMFRPTEELRENLGFWLKNEQGFCRGRGKI